MNMPVWTASIKPAFWGAVIGAVALTFVGFNYGGWVTGGTAKQMAEEAAQGKLVSALLPLCIEKANRDPMMKANLVALEKESSWQRGQKLASFGWANAPGTNKPYDSVAEACVEHFSKSFAK
jgi:hypothetical protein